MGRLHLSFLRKQIVWRIQEKGLCIYIHAAEDAAQRVILVVSAEQGHIPLAQRIAHPDAHRHFFACQTQLLVGYKISSTKFSNIPVASPLN